MIDLLFSAWVVNMVNYGNMMSGLLAFRFGWFLYLKKNARYKSICWLVFFSCFFEHIIWSCIININSSSVWLKNILAGALSKVQRMRMTAYPEVATVTLCCVEVHNAGCLALSEIFFIWTGIPPIIKFEYHRALLNSTI